MKHLIVDASVFGSDSHASALAKWKGKGTHYIAPALAKLLDSPVKSMSDKVQILSHFAERRKAFVGKELYRSAIDLRESCRVYEPQSDAIEFATKLTKSETAHLPPIVTQILIEEIAFMREHSSIVMKGKATIRLLKKLRVPILDFGDAFFGLKERLPRSRGARRLKWLVGGLAQIAAWSNLSRDPLLAATLNAGGWVIWVTDP